MIGIAFKTTEFSVIFFVEVVVLTDISNGECQETRRVKGNEKYVISLCNLILWEALTLIIVLINGPQSTKTIATKG